MNYNYLFPYEKIPSGSKILIYGAGDLGQDYLLQMQITNYCEVVAVADRNYFKYPAMTVPLIGSDRIYEYDFDYVVIALRMGTAYPEIKRILNSQGIEDDRIVCVFERDIRDVSVFGQTEDNELSSDCAYDLSDESIAILTAGGFGDMVIQKRFIMEMIKYAPQCRMDLYNIKAIDFLKHLYSDTDSVNRVIEDLGYRYRVNRNRYALALVIEGGLFVRVDVWNKERAGEVFPPDFVRRISLLKANSDKEGFGITTPYYLAMTRRRFKGLNAYNGFNYDGAFEIEDKDVDIPLDNEFWEVFKQLNLGSYVTVNYGNGDSEDASTIAKSWKKESFEKVIRMIKESYPDIRVIQLGGVNAYRLRGADNYVLGEDFRLVMHMLNNSMLHVDIEGGLVHIATQLGTKCVVLFGPTVPDYYGYEQNINIRVGDCRECWGLYSDVNRCARDMKEPECMSRIKPDTVMEKIDEYLSGLVRD